MPGPEGVQAETGEGRGGGHRPDQQAEAAGDGGGRVRRAPLRPSHRAAVQGGPGPGRRGRVQQAQQEVHRLGYPLI